MYKKINKLRQINQHINYQYIILQTYKRIDASVLYDNKQQLRTYAFTEQDNKMSLIKASLIRGYKSQQSETFFHRTCIVSTRNQIVLHAGQAVTEKKRRQTAVTGTYATNSHRIQEEMSPLNTGVIRSFLRR